MLGGECALLLAICAAESRLAHISVLHRKYGKTLAFLKFFASALFAGVGVIYQRDLKVKGDLATTPIKQCYDDKTSLSGDPD